MKGFQFTKSELSRILISTENTSAGIETKGPLYDMPNDVRMSYVLESVLNLENPVSIEEIVTMRQNLQYIISNRLRNITR